MSSALRTSSSATASSIEPGITRTSPSTGRCWPIRWQPLQRLEFRAGDKALLQEDRAPACGQRDRLAGGGDLADEDPARRIALEARDRALALTLRRVAGDQDRLVPGQALDAAPQRGDVPAPEPGPSARPRRARPRSRPRSRATLASASSRRSRATLPSTPRRSPVAIAARSCSASGLCLRSAIAAASTASTGSGRMHQAQRRQIALDLLARRPVPERPQPPGELRAWSRIGADNLLDLLHAERVRIVAQPDQAVAGDEVVVAQVVDQVGRQRPQGRPELGGMAVRRRAGQQDHAGAAGEQAVAGAAWAEQEPGPLRGPALEGVALVADREVEAGRKRPLRRRGR